jgi:hypothetical protein
MNEDHPFFDVDQFKFDEKLEKQKFIDNMNYLKAMSVEEATFYKKWDEVKDYRDDFASRSDDVKYKIWKPKDIYNEELTLKELEELNPTIVHVETEQQELDWLMLRVFCHTMEFSQTPGRFLKFLITDGNSERTRYLGAVSVSSDVITITDRDKYIGWTPKNKLEDGKLVHSAIGSCIMSTQPFGYNFLGGKLVACLVTSSVVRDVWKKLYNQTLVGMTTTSLYGSYSMYNSLKWWHKCGTSAGKIPIKPDDTVYEKWHNWIKENKADEYNKKMTQKDDVSGPVTGAKQRVISMIFQHLNIKTQDYVHGYERGVYYSSFYENTREFLQGKVTEDQLVMKKLFSDDTKSILDWWRVKAKDRYLKLKTENNLKKDVLYYNAIMDMSYQTAKNNFFQDVGR